MQSPVHVSTQVSSNRNFQDFQYPKYAAIMQPPEEQMLQQQQYPTLVVANRTNKFKKKVLRE